MIDPLYDAALDPVRVAFYFVVAALVTIIAWPKEP